MAGMNWEEQPHIILFNVLLRALAGQTYYDWFQDKRGTGDKPVGAEVNTCNDYLANELSTLEPGSVVLALGGIAHKAVIRALGLRQADYKFAHAAVHDLGGFRLLDSYHCSRYNTNTGRLTREMFEKVFASAREMLQN